MKAARFIKILLVLFIFCSCSQEKSILSDYRHLAKELKMNSSDYSAEDWEDVVRKYEKLEKKVTKCNFSQKEKKELNRLRGQCAAYMVKAITKQTKIQMEDVMEQISDMAEGFNEVLSEEDIDNLFNNDDE